MCEACVKKSAQSAKNGQESNGGNGFTAEFISYATEATNIIESEGGIYWNQRLVSKSVERLKATLSKMVVEATTKTLTNKNKPVSALNYPLNGTVIFNENDWKVLNSDGKLQLAMHEILSLTFLKTELDDTNPDFIVTRDILNKDLIRHLQSRPPLYSIVAIAEQAALTFAVQKVGDQAFVIHADTMISTNYSQNQMTSNTDITIYVFIGTSLEKNSPPDFSVVVNMDDSGRIHDVHQAASGRVE
jgi:hypothetical protein